MVERSASGSTCAVAESLSVFSSVFVVSSEGIASVSELRSNSFAIAEGLTAVAAGSTIWVLGPTWAGATELALMAAQISSAERSEATILSVVSAVIRPTEALTRGYNFRFAPGWIPVSRGASVRSFGGKAPPALTFDNGPIPASLTIINPRRSFQR